jgi:hypothetical protein
MSSRYTMRTRGSEVHMFETIESEEFWSIVIILDLYWKWKIGSDNRNGCR